MCRRYRQRPSEVVGMTGALALDFDLAMAAVHRMEDESKASELAQSNPLLAMMLMTAM